MEIAFVLYKFFPFGGLQRDFLRIAQSCQARGYKITVYTMSWEGDIPQGFKVNIHHPFAFSACRRNEKFYDWVKKTLLMEAADIVIGFNKMPGIDIYYAADTCYEHKAKTLRGKLYHYGRRYKHFSAYENAVFSSESTSEILLISDVQKELFIKYYGTQPKRMHLLPPGVATDRKRGHDAHIRRRNFREKYQINDQQKLLVLLGSGFITKGLDRALNAIASLEKPLRETVCFFVVGKDNPDAFKRQAKRLGIANQVVFFSGMDDVPSLLQGADVLVHPAYNENTGTVLLEAVTAGLPVLCTDVCGYAHYIKEADAGLVTPSPFDQQIFSHQLREMLTSKQRQKWIDNALDFADKADLYSMPEKVADFIEAHLKSKKQLG